MKRSLVIISFWLVSQAPVFASIAVDATLPQVTPDTSRIAPTGAVRTIPGTCPATAVGLQDCINQANAASAGTTCDVVEIAAGTTIAVSDITEITIPAGAPRTCYVEIRSGGYRNLPEGARVTPADAADLATVDLSTRELSFYKGLRFAEGAAYWRLIGLQVRANASETAQIVCLVCLFTTAAGNEFSSESDAQHHIILDRLWLHGNGRPSRNALVLAGDHISLIDSTVEDIHARDTFTESHAFYIPHYGSGYLIQNNTIEGETIAILFGGGGNNPGGSVERDITIRRNHITKRRSWNPNDPSYAESEGNSKVLIEMKSGKRVLFEGNIFDYSFQIDDQDASIFNIVNHDSQFSNGILTEDITIQNNWGRHANHALRIQAGGCSATPPCRNNINRITVTNNLWTDTGCNALYRRTTICRGALFLICESGGAEAAQCNDLKVQHNTFLNSSGIVFNGDWSGGGINFTFLSNIALADEYGFYSASCPCYGTAGLSDGSNNTFVVENNILIDNLGLHKDHGPAGSNQWTGTVASVGWTSTRCAFSTSSACNELLDLDGLQLAAGSSFKNDGHDGADPGVNIDTLLAALGGSSDSVAPSAPANLRVQ